MLTLLVLPVLYRLFHREDETLTQLGVESALERPLMRRSTRMPRSTDYLCGLHKLAQGARVVC